MTEDCGSTKRAPGCFKWQAKNLESHEGIEVTAEDAVRPEYINFFVEQRFKDKASLVFAIQSYAVYHAYKLKNTCCSPIKIITRCIGNGEHQCSWRIYATILPGGTDVFRVVTYTGIHSCYKIGVLPRQDPQVMVDWVAGVISPYIASKPDYPVKLIQVNFEVQFHMKLSYKTAWRAKESSGEGNSCKLPSVIVFSLKPSKNI